MEAGIHPSMDDLWLGDWYEPCMREPAFAPLFATLRLALSAVVLGLAVLVIVRGMMDGTAAGWTAVVLSVVFLVVYGLGSRQLEWWQESRAALIVAWLTALTVLALVLIWITPNAAYLVFPLFILYLALLPGNWGIAAIAVSMALMFGILAVEERLTTGGVAGPIIAAVVSVTIGLGYRALYWESQERQRLIEQLLVTRGELAEREREAGTLMERARLAREIHDTVAQGLSSIQMLLHAAERADGERPGIEHVRLARETAAQNLEETRRFIQELTPPALEDQSLAGALDRLAQATEQANPHLSVGFQTSGDTVPLPMPVETALLRIAQGAIANVVQHADARHVQLTLTFLGEAVSLDVVDDGVGFDVAAQASAAATNRRPSFGLVAMRERVAKLGGDISVESMPGKGTALAITFGLGT